MDAIAPQVDGKFMSAFIRAVKPALPRSLLWSDLLQLSVSERATMQAHYNVLFLCTGNSARSIMAEAILNSKGRPNFTAYSAGSHPAGTVRPEALRQLESAHLPTAGLRSKSWDEFAQAWRASTRFRLHRLRQRRERSCPIWPGQPMTAHWGIPDPAAVQGTAEQVGTRISRSFLSAGPQDQPVSEPAARHPGPACAQERTRQHRPKQRISQRRHQKMKYQHNLAV